MSNKMLPTKENSYLISIGSNLDDSIIRVTRALTLLREKLACRDNTPPRLTPPEDYPASDKPFCNCLSFGKTTMSLPEVLSVLEAVESEAGRRELPKIPGYVSIDIDLLTWNNEVLRRNDVARHYIREELPRLGAWQANLPQMLRPKLRKLDITEMERLSPETFKAEKKLPLLLIADNIRSLNNIGSLFRTADAFRLQAVYLCGISCPPPHPDIRKTALGAEESVPWRYFADTLEAVEEAHRQGYIVCALEQAQGSISLEHFSPAENESYALVLGNEVEGVAPKVIENIDLCLEIPQFGTKHSLNVSVACGIALWQTASKMFALLYKEEEKRKRSKL